MMIGMKREIPLVTLETKRLRIVPMTYDAFLHALHDDTVSVEDKEAMEELYERMRHDRKKRFAWYTNRLLYRKEDGVCIGSISYMNSPQKDPDHLGLVEIGYNTQKEFRGQGYMTEAVDAMCDWALAQPKVYGMIAGVRDGNPASSRVLEKCGFVMTDHSERLALQVWKKLPGDRKPLSLWDRIL